MSVLDTIIKASADLAAAVERETGFRIGVVVEAPTELYDRLRIDMIDRTGANLVTWRWSDLEIGTPHRQLVIRRRA